MKKSLLFAVFSMLVMQISTYAAISPCVSGAAGRFECKRVDLMSEVDLKNSGIKAEGGNDIWGWTDPVMGREYAIMGMDSKTSFVDITDPERPLHLGDLRTHTEDSLWRDIKVYKDHAFIVSEAGNHGLQIFDLKQLRQVNSSPAVKFQETAFYGGFGSAHNLFINEQTATAYIVGTDTCDAGMHVVDVSTPVEPRFITCVDKAIFEPVRSGDDKDKFHPDSLILHGEDYTHDVQCVNYHGPDERYQGHEICVASNADTVNIVDMSDKRRPVQIAVKGYSGLGYVHQGWLTEDHHYFLLGDELDEIFFKHPTKTLIWDMSDLRAPKLVGAHVHKTKSIDHNMYVKGDFVYQANYLAGLRIFSLAQVAQARLTEVAYFDTVPGDDRPNFEGTWSVYPYFESGIVVLSNIDGFLYVVKPKL